ncbi:MAG TPA: hypothetical protein VMF69_11215 [Gemmataceae bacterium]|nr:hypothetical protein [Gemmataceae bacterium]
MTTKRKIAEQAQDNSTLASDETAFGAASTQTASQAAQTAAPLATADTPTALREPGADDPAAEHRKASWAPRTTIAVPLTQEAKRDHTKGEVARYIDGYNFEGVGARIDSPDQGFRPSEEVKEALKEEHPYRESMRWNKKHFHKKVSGKRPDGSDRSPVAERLDAEGRFEDMVLRRREEIEKPGGSGKAPF